MPGPSHGTAAGIVSAIRRDRAGSNPAGGTHQKIAMGERDHMHSTIARQMITKRFMAMVLAWVAITILTLGVCAACGGNSEGGWYQGGGDSVPHDRR